MTPLTVLQERPTTSTSATLEIDGALKAWLEHLDLYRLWLRAGLLPEKRCDFYRAQILRMYVATRRREERANANRMRADR